MKNKFDLLIFDVDGTLLDTREGILSSVKFTAQKFKFKPLSDEEIERIFIGPPILKGFQTAYDLKTEDAQCAVKVFREHYSTCDLYRAKPYQGVFELLKYLVSSNIQIAVATYKREDYAKKLLAHFGFDRYTKNIHGADAEGKKSKTDIIFECVEECGAQNLRRILMVGDGENDEKGARCAGVEFLGVTFGFGFSVSESYPFPVKNSFEEIITYLKES